MRLTLRTLLAYLDDTLEPAQAKVVGQKITESEEAQQLVQRIKDALRKPDVAVPSSTGGNTGVDAHTVAEYLDDDLPVDRAAEVEAVLRSSEAHLAEVAACHQILSLLGSESSQVSLPARQRMYALSRGRAAAQQTAEQRTAGAEGEQAERGAKWKRYWPAAAAAALVVGLAVAIWQLLPPASSPGPENRIALNTDSPPQPAAVPAPPAPPPAPDPVPMPTPTPPMPVGSSDPPPPETPTDRPSNERKEMGAYAGGPRPGILVRPAAGPDSWQRLGVRDRVSSSEPLVSLPGYRSDVLLDSGVRVVLFGNLIEFVTPQSLAMQLELPVLESRVLLHVPSADHDADLTLHHGRIVLANAKAQGGTRVHLRFQDQIWDVLLDEPGTEVSAEICGRYPRGVPFSKQPGGEGPDQQLLLFGLKGEARLKIDTGSFALPIPSGVYWSPSSPYFPSPRPIPQVPDWWTGSRATTPEAQQMLAATDELNLSLNRPGARLSTVLEEFRQDPNPGRRLLAIQCLGAIDDLASLTAALEDPRADVRQMATLTLRHWIGSDGQRDLQLFDFLRARRGLPDNQAEDVMMLLHSFSDVDANRPETYDMLIHYLMHDKTAIRELAYFHLSRLVPAGAKKFPYDAGASEDRRKAVVQQWRTWIPDGQLPPRP